MISKDNASILREKGYTYIIHISRPENYNKMRHVPYIMTPVERHVSKVDVEGVLSISEINFDNPVYKIAMCEYPGIFMGLTRKTLDELREIYEGRCLLVFPLELMNQKNWHFNINDRNGFFFPDTITSNKVEEIPPANLLPKYNEIVFHNRIPLSNLIEVFSPQIDWKPEFKLDLDLETPPCNIYYTGGLYSGIQYPFFRSPSERLVSNEFMYAWYQKYLPEEWKSIIQPDMDLVKMDLALFETIVPSSGMNIMDHYFRYRISSD